MKHTVRHIEGDRWTVMDADDAPAFSGTLQECEDWLDRRENRKRERASLLRRVSHWVCGLGTPSPKQPQPHRTAESTEPNPADTPPPNEADGNGPTGGEPQ